MLKINRPPIQQSIVPVRDLKAPCGRENMRKSYCHSSFLYRAFGRPMPGTILWWKCQCQAIVNQCEPGNSRQNAVFIWYLGFWTSLTSWESADTCCDSSTRSETRQQWQGIICSSAYRFTCHNNFLFLIQKSQVTSSLQIVGHGQCQFLRNQHSEERPCILENLVKRSRIWNVMPTSWSYVD